MIRVIADGEDVWWQFTDLLVFVLLNMLSRVNWKDLVRVDGHQDGPGVSLQDSTVDKIPVHKLEFPTISSFLEKHSSALSEIVKFNYR